MNIAMVTSMHVNEMLPAAQVFIKQVRRLYEDGRDVNSIWTQAQTYLSSLLTDPEVIAHSASWPETPAILGLQGKHANLIFYEDPDYKFVINGLIKVPHAKTTVHDHGKSWTLYGVVKGKESVLRFRRTDGGEPGDLPARASVVPSEEAAVMPGYVDLIKPWDIHAEYNGPESTTAIIVRSQRSGTYIQNIFYTDVGTVEQYWGPKQIPFLLG